MPSYYSDLCAACSYAELTPEEKLRHDRREKRRIKREERQAWGYIPQPPDPSVELPEDFKRALEPAFAETAAYVNV
jgi:hypothetical protein